MAKVYYFDLEGAIQERQQITLKDWDNTKEYALQQSISITTTPTELLQQKDASFMYLLHLARLSLPKDIIVELLVNDSVESTHGLERFIKWRYDSKIKQTLHNPKQPIRRSKTYYLGRVAVP